MDSRVDEPHSSAMSRTDLADVRAALRGDGDAYGRIVRRYQDEVAGRMWRFTSRRAELEELVQEVFVEAYTSLGTYRGEAPLGHWLARIATRVGYRFWKRRDRRRARSALPLEDWDAIAADDPEPARARELLDGLLARLRPRDRLVLTLVYLEGLSVAQAAELTGWSRTTVKVQAHRARKRLRRLFERAAAGGRAGAED
jgi:RNA polymerase sigma-70 factor (ECF subfamily)